MARKHRKKNNEPEAEKTVLSEKINESESCPEEPEMTEDAPADEVDTANEATDVATDGETDEATAEDADTANDEAAAMDKEEEKEFVPVTPEEFEESVKELTEDNITGNKGTKKKNGVLGNILSYGLIAVFATVFIICAVWLVDNISDKVKGGNIYSEATNNFEVFVPGQNTSSDAVFTAGASDAPMLTLHDRLAAGDGEGNSQNSQYSEQLRNMRASISALKDINPDVYGWIYVENSAINFPIMRGDDNEYYLDRAYTGDYVAIGSIFADCSTEDLITDNYNTVLYGHNVNTAAKESSMFHDVTKFLQQDFFDANLIYVYTLDGVFIYKPFSIYPTTADNFYFRTSFAGKSSFYAFALELKASSIHANDVALTQDDTIITLSTCTNGAQNGRYALHAVLTEVIS